MQNLTQIYSGVMSLWSTLPTSGETHNRRTETKYFIANSVKKT